MPPPATLQSSAANPDTLITVKVTYEGLNRRFKLPLRDLGAYTFPQKIHELLDIPTENELILERYSDSAGSYVVLNSGNPSVYKQLYRAAKAKLKLRITVSAGTCAARHETPQPQPQPQMEQEAPKDQTHTRGSYLDTVLRHPEQTSDTHNTSSVEPEERSCSHDVDKFQIGHLNQTPAFNTLSPALLHPPFSRAIFIDCNHCGASIPNEHYHCSICEEGDYDLCQQCVDAGVLCPGQFHWLIKRSVIDGSVVNSTTETICPKIAPSDVKSDDDTTAEVEETPVEDEKDTVETRTCNCCVQHFSITEMAVCDVCPDYDLCFDCLLTNTHGHHPGHSFSILHDDDHHVAFDMTMVKSFCKPGRVRTHPAICDGCDKHVIGVRNKCLDCPDWDFCDNCMETAAVTHAGHRFVPVYDPIPVQSNRLDTHFGVFCDGSACATKMGRSYIIGTRYKCAVCHDTDFCARCEAHPENTHNRTHPLLKFKTAVKRVSVSTYGENKIGGGFDRMGDRPVTKSTSTETVAPLISNASTQMNKSPEPELKPSSPEPVQSEEKEEKMTNSMHVALAEGLQAHFVSDTIADGTKLPPTTVITQTWTLHNPGPAPWPKGCSVRFVGGDGMFNVDTRHPISVDSLVVAMESQELSEPILPDSSADFTVTLKTPQRVGKAISYWRLKTPEGVPFGHKLWCEIDVQPATAEPETKVCDNGDKKPASNEAGSGLDTKSEQKVEESLSGSEMVFPKLEKESTATSVEATPPLVAEGGDDDAHDLTEDIESLAIGSEATDDGFLTDEEYDILDASDEEFIAESGKAEQK